MPAGLFEHAAPLSDFLARVVLERGIDHSDGLTYAVPLAMADLQPGERVRAPLGKGDRPTDGYVIEVYPASQPGRDPGDLDPARIKPLLSRASRSDARAPRFTPALIRLAQWIGHYYCTPIGMVLAAMMPAAVKKQVGAASHAVLELVPGAQESAQKLTASALAAWDAVCALPPGALPSPPRDLAATLGLRTTAPLGRLVKAGLLRVGRVHDVRARDPAWLWQNDAAPAHPPLLTPHQRDAANAVVASLGTFRSFLLHGVTGSGKTEVYLHALAGALERGPAIVLVPEIALTPQTASRFLARFGPGVVAVLHSGLTQAQRHQEWSRVASGAARVVVGARSAVFAPCAGGLSLIVVDEEHDGSYKQDQLPRYHARDVALRRGQLEGCPVILGSATPSLESWHNALPADRGGAGRSVLLRLPNRVAGGVLPPVEIVDLSQAQRQRPASDRRPRALTQRLEHEIARTLAGSGQIILLLNRRGFASYICCADVACGWYLTCPHCDVTAVYHRDGGRERAGAGGQRQAPGRTPVVKCHHCLGQQTLPKVCRLCGKGVSLLGFGTQRVEEELARTFPALAHAGALLRLDADSVRGAADYFQTLEQFRSGGARCLLGTQMIAKGLDFPAVELIGVINADTALSLPDFRAAERTFQLVTQVAGRAGRSTGSAGVSRVLVQTMSPSEPAIALASRHDYEGFAALELGFRREAVLPPIGRMARIVCRDTSADKAERRAHEIAAALSAPGAGPDPESGLRVKGPMVCPIARIAGHYRYAVEILAPGTGPIQRALAHLRSSGLARSDAHTAVDVDPQALL